MQTMLRLIRKEHNCLLLMKLAEPTDRMMALDEYDDQEKEPGIISFEDEVKFIGGIIANCKDIDTGKLVDSHS